MTVAEATTIADNALEHSVRTVLASLAAPLFLAWRSGTRAGCTELGHGWEEETQHHRGCAAMACAQATSGLAVPACLQAALRGFVGHPQSPDSPLGGAAALLPGTAARGVLTAPGVSIVGV